MPGINGRVLVIAGSDSGGGAGIQADIKTIAALGGYATTALTALTAQNTLGVRSVYPVPVSFVAEQMRAVLDDIGTDAVKTGMLHDTGVIHTVAEVLKEYASAPLILDPVMLAKGGTALLLPEAIDALIACLCPHAALLTPNLPEAEALLVRMTHQAWNLRNPEEISRAGAALFATGARAILIKGGHGDGDTLTDWLFSEPGALPVPFTASRLPTRHTHGTGCTLASAIAVRLAQKKSLSDAVSDAHAYVQRALKAAPGLGRGHGPLGHFPSPA